MGETMNRAATANERSWVNTPMASCLPSAEVYERVRQASSHDARLKILYEQYGDPCLAYARRYARRGLPALVAPEDLVQELFLKIAARQCLHRYEVKRAWILCCLKNAWIDAHRKHRTRPIPFDLMLEAEAVDAFDLAILTKHLHVHLVALRQQIRSEPDEVVPCKQAIFDEWMDDLFGRAQPGEGAPSQRLESNAMRVKRHRCIEGWRRELTDRLHRASGVEQLREWQSLLSRRNAAGPDGSERAPDGAAPEGS
jgi:DNA-directed RNA polymerase specialized sigma24 family protein